MTPPAPRPARLRAGWLAGGLVAVAVAVVAGVAFGPVTLPPGSVAAELLNLVPGVRLNSGLDAREIAIITELRLPRVVLGLLVGAMLAMAGAAYQGVFRNPLADPHLLGVAAGAGLGVTAVVTFAASRAGDAGSTGAGVADATANLPIGVPPAAFLGALVALALTWTLGAAGGRDRTPATLILAGVAVSAFLAAAQTFLMQQHVETLRQVYSWLLGRLATAGWHDVLLILPYAVVTGLIVLSRRRELDVLTVGDEEAASLGLHPQRSRYLLLIAASLGTAAAVSVSGLIGFVGIIVPHTLRLLSGASYRSLLPLSILFGAAFLTLTDVVARTVAGEAEIPIGVVTAFFGAPFFILVLRTSRSVAP
jgi:iron complex transport system permease protein